MRKSQTADTSEKDTRENVRELLVKYPVPFTPACNPIIVAALDEAGKRGLTPKEIKIVCGFSTDHGARQAADKVVVAGRAEKTAYKGKGTLYKIVK